MEHFPSQESESVEFKRSLAEVESGLKALCGMLNGSFGGTVYFGIADSGRVVGVDKGDRSHDRMGRREVQRVLQRMRLKGIVALSGTRRGARWSLVGDL